MPVTVSAEFGASGITTFGPCPDQTSPKSGCLEGYELGASALNVYVWSTRPPAGTVDFVGLCDTNGCWSSTNTSTLTGATSTSPAGPMARRMFTLARPTNRLGGQLCAYRIQLVTFPTEAPTPGGPPGGSRPSVPPNDHWGCRPYLDQRVPVGAVEVTRSRGQIDVAGWVINPSADTPVALEVVRGGTVVPAVADQPQSKSKTRWPQFSENHGFAASLPFQGSGGPHKLCLVVPGAVFPDGTNTLGCLDYREVPQLSFDRASATVGDKIVYRADMLDPGAHVVMNLRADQGFYLLPWALADVADFTADGVGHFEGTLDTSRVPPGTYEAVFSCDVGCSALQPIPNSPAVRLPGGAESRVGAGLGDIVLAGAGASLTVTQPQPTTIRVAGASFPPTAEIVVVFSPGLDFHEGVPMMVTEYVTSDAGGTFTVDLPVPRAAVRNVIYATSGDTVLASAEFP